MAIPSTQKAWVYKEFGPKENLSLTDVPLPVEAPDQVLIKVHAASLNPIDTMRRLGLFSRIGAVDTLPTVPGYDVAGEVVKVGADVTKFRVGDRVYGDVHEQSLAPQKWGTLAQYTIADEKVLAVIPERLSFAEAASLPAVITTAYQALALGGAEEGKSVLILGGSGGVGSMGVQLAKHVFKASTVAATASTTKVDLVKGLGADVVIDYKKENLADHPTKYDVVLDTVGQGETLVALKEDGKGVVLSGQGKPPVLNFGVQAKGDDLEKLNPLLQDGTLKPFIDPKTPFKWSDVVEAYGYLEGGGATGKVVVSPIE